MVAIFIEGTRKAEMSEAKAGAGRIAVVEEMQVIPVAIRGTANWRPGRQAHIVFGTPVANRQRPELEGLIGLFVNTLVLRLAVQSDVPLRDFLGLVREVTLGAYDHQDAPFEKVCYIGCGVTTGVGVVINTAKVEAGANVVVFGLGGIGLNVIQGAHMVGANKIIGVDVNPRRKALAEQSELSVLVGRALADLPENLRVPLVLRFYAGLTEREIATPSSA